MVVAPRSQLIARWLGGSFLLVMGTVLVLCASGVRFGQGYFAYRYSPMRESRTIRASFVIVFTALAAGAVWRLSLRRKWGGGMLVGALVLATGWLVWAPPNPLQQHAFNLRSMSSDGAFVTEAENVGSLPGYLRSFDERLKRTPKEMGGTRVLSNPPGMTAIAYGVFHAWPARVGPLGGVEKILVERFEIPAADVTVISNSLKVAALLCVVWAAACVAGYFLARLYLSPAGAAVVAIVMCFNPMTVHFVPGKDPGQLLTINLMLLAWLGPWKNRSWVWAAVAGALFVIGMTIGLVHIWVALAMVLGTGWDAWSTRGSGGIRRLVLQLSAAAAGAGVIVIGAYAIIGWNIPMQTLAVLRRFGELQETFERNRAIWLLIGLPSFLLFTGIGFWALVGLRWHRRSLGFGGRLALTTGAVMLLTYFMGVTYELPRLWVAFLPLLTLGLAMDLSLLKGRGAHRNVGKTLVLIVTVQLVATGLHWTLFDVREAEYRLLTKRLYE
jgi:hypothetical protein